MMINGKRLKRWMWREWSSIVELAEALEINREQAYRMTRENTVLDHDTAKRLIEYMGAKDALTVIDFGGDFEARERATLAVTGGAL